MATVSFWLKSPTFCYNKYLSVSSLCIMSRNIEVFYSKFLACYIYRRVITSFSVYPTITLNYSRSNPTTFFSPDETSLATRTEVSDCWESVKS